MSAPMQIEYFEKGGQDTPLVLIFGYHIPSARELFHAIRALRDDRETEIPVHKLPGYECVNISGLTFLHADTNRGLTRKDDRFTLELNDEGWEEAEGHLAPFCDRYAAPGGFQWLYQYGSISLIFSTGRGW